MITYTTLMSVCQRAGEWRHAILVFQKMDAAGVEADVVAYNSAIAACAKGHDWEKAWAVFMGMQLLLLGAVSCHRNDAVIMRRAQNIVMQ